MSLFRSVALTQISHTTGHREHGSWVEGAETATSFMSTWQPASGKDMQKLAEGKRSSETMKCFAPIDLHFTTADASTSVSGDRIEADGMRYEVVLATKWNNGLLPHWELLCGREHEGET